MSITSADVGHSSSAGSVDSDMEDHAIEDEESTSDDTLGEDVLATESGDLLGSDGSGSASSSTTKRKHSGRGTGKVPEPTPADHRPVIEPSGDK
jgi:hypothetical protein